MNNKKSTKRALLSSVLSLVLCMTMLIGTTFAWFTDSVTSSGNIIKSGTLDVTMEWADGTKTVPAADSSDWKDASTGPIFKSELWEPGYTEVRHIKIANEGTLALKYQLNILANGEVSELADVIDVYYLDPAEQLADRADIPVEKKLGTLAEVLANISTTASGNLPAGENHTITLALKMQESAGNEYQGLAIGTDFSVQLLATQLTAESDSFGNDYDADLEAMQQGVSRTLEDGSTAFYYNEESGFGGRVRLTALPENLGDEYVVPAEVNDLGGALVRVTLDKLTVSANVEYAYKSLEGATIEEIVIEDGATTIPNRMFYKTNVENVVIPSSVKVVEESAFQQVNLEELVVPANVEIFGVHAFAGSQLKKITFEGSNLVFDNRPMRECANLRNVIFNCENITFMNSTTNGDCWISNKGANGANYSNITFQVKNETVAAKVREAIKHENPETTPIYIEDMLFTIVKNVSELKNVLNSTTQNTIISVTADITGDVTINQNVNKHLVIDGNGNKYDGTINIKAQSDTTASGTITIKDVNFKTTDAERNFIYSSETNHYPLNVTVSNCSFEGSGADSDVVGISIKSAKNFVIEKCTATKVHSILQNTSGWDLTIRNVTVNDAGRGMALGTVQGVTLTNVKVEATKYGVRLDAGYNNNAVLTDCDITAFIPVVVRKVTKDSNMTFNGTNTMIQTNTDNIWCAIGSSEYEVNGTLPTTATKTVTVTVNDTGLNRAGIYNNSGK